MSDDFNVFSIKTFTSSIKTRRPYWDAFSPDSSTDWHELAFSPEIEA